MVDLKKKIYKTIFMRSCVFLADSVGGFVAKLKEFKLF